MIIPATHKHVAATLETLIARLETDHRAEVPDRRDNGRLCVSAPLVIGTCLRNLDDQNPQNAPGRFQPLHYGWIIDLSMHGIGFLLEHELPTGMTVWTDLTALSDTPLMLPVRTIYCRQIMPHTWRVGACFESDT